MTKLLGLDQYSNYAAYRRFAVMVEFGGLSWPVRFRALEQAIEYKRKMNHYAAATKIVDTETGRIIKDDYKPEYKP